MQLALAAAAVLLAILTPVLADDGGCRDATEVEAFAASHYSAMVVLHPPELLNMTLDGGEAGMKLFKVVKQCLEDHQQCNADSVAYRFGQAVARARTVNLKGYFKHTAYTVARSLFKFGILNCSNAVALSLEYIHFGYVEYYKYTQDENSFDTYMHDLVYALVDLLLAHDLKLEDTTQEIADAFYDSYKDEKSDCNFDKSTN